MNSWLVRVFASALVRKLAYLLVAGALAYFSIGHARAAGVTQAQAYANCMAYVTPLTNQVAANNAAAGWQVRNTKPACKTWTNGSAKGYEGDGSTQRSMNGTTWYTDHQGAGHIFNYDIPCATGEQVVSDGAGGYKCDDPNKRCLALNDGIKNQGPVPRTWTSMCLASGCNAVLDDPTVTTISGTSTTIYRGTLRYTGACGTTPSPDDPDWDGGNDDNKPRPECAAAGSGQTMCIKPNGDHCYSASTGRQICWRPGETGDKGDGGVNQHRNPGPTEQPPPSPPDDTYTKNGDSITTNTTNTTTNITTTTTNYTLNNGTEPPGVDQSGEPGGTGSTGGQDDGEGDKELLTQIAANTKGTNDFLRGGNPSDYPDTSGGATSGTVTDTAYGDTGFDSSGYGWARSCPGPTTVEVLGNSITFDPSSIMCDWVTVGGYFVLLIVGWRCLAMLGKA